jgi:hypothetical protein
MKLMAPSRSTWTSLSDAQLVGQCEVDTYRASGPGGQKRNKTSSAVRLRHLPSGVIVIAEESRSQHENKAKALRRLRQALFLLLRNALSLDPQTLDGLARHPDFEPARSADGKLHVGRKDARYWPAVGVVLDVLEAMKGRVSDVASALGTTTANLVDFLEQEPKVWQQVNQLRARFGQKPLK